MDLWAQEHFLLKSGKLRLLRPCTATPENGFILVPYVNPRDEKISTYFFEFGDEIKMPEQKPTKEQTPVHLKSSIGKEDYIRKIKKLREHIQRGDVYEINYCMEFFAEDATIDCLEVFRKLESTAKAPYSMLLKTGDNVIMCASPELFLQKKGTLLISKPIKGTIRRGTTAKEDEELKQTLQHSLKDRTENVMAVDVARNDLSIIAQRGTVKVNQLYNIESFETVHQMVTTVSCELKPGLDFDQVLHATFPMASMTGAPKISAMNLISAHENFKRGWYSGCMGIVKDSDYTLAVLIRSIFYNLKSRRLSIAVGGAITYLSDPEKEYEECLLKARTMLAALNAVIV